jgi:hypothetical protein
MSVTGKMIFLLASIAAMLFLPWLGGYFYYDGSFPADFFAYPPLKPMDKPDFDLLIFIGVTIICAGITAVYIFPKWFGFKQLEPSEPQNVKKEKLPYWFWLGLVCWGVSLTFLGLHAKQPAWFIHWSDVPLFWGLVLMLDGWVYKRTGGNSLVAKIPQELIGIGVASMTGWMIFEFLNFFVDDNWYYPWGNLLDREEFLLYAFVVSSGLMPLAFEFYLLFISFPKLAKRFSQGKKIVLSALIKNIVLVLALGSMFASGLFPDMLFFTLWVSPPVILAIVLNKIGVWTPLDPIAEGNWSPALLSALTYFVAGFCLEGQNYLSAIHDGQKAIFTMDPAYWQYSLPYVNVGHIFEMPFLGLFGYLPFGIYCWLWWIACATLLNIPAKFLKENPLNY